MLFLFAVVSLKPLDPPGFLLARFLLRERNLARRFLVYEDLPRFAKYSELGKQHFPRERRERRKRWTNSASAGVLGFDDSTMGAGCKNIDHLSNANISEIIDLARFPPSYLQPAFKRTRFKKKK